MKITILGINMIMLLFFISCIKDEEPFKEADIVKISLPDHIMADAMYDKNKVTVIVYDTTGFSNKIIAPKIEVSPGATISPISGTPVKLNKYLTSYKVTAEDGIGSKEYIIQFVPFVPLKFDFEDWQEYIFLGKRYEMLKDPLWTNANLGIRIIFPKNKPFPTRKTEDSYSGKYAVLLETNPGNTFFKSPIFPGSMYRGVFELTLSDPIVSAKFGQIHSEYIGKPDLFTGYYKYKPGNVFKDENLQEIKGKIDECDIYAVLFKVTKGAAGRNEYLTAVDIGNSDRIVAKAFLKDRTAKDQYTKFEIPFTYSEELNYKAYDYKLAVVFSSSKEGAYFRGAVGSTLIVDEVEIKCKEPDKLSGDQEN